MVEAGSGKVVHHLDFNKKNNNPDNFDCSMDYMEHRQYHSKLTEKTINSPENIAKRVKEQKKNNHFEIAGRKGGLKSADKLVKWLEKNGPWNRGKLSGEIKNCVKCEEQYLNHQVVSVEFLTETRDTCDLTITKYHNFATSAGVIIHNSKATLAAEDVRFARTIERVQKIVVAELSKIAIIHLYSQGFEDAELINFDLELQNPSMIHEQEKLELLTQQVDIANSLIENKLLSREWIYDNIFEFNQQEKETVFDGVVEDRKQVFRFEQIETEGNDPAESGEVSGDEDDLEMARKGDWGGDRRSGTGEKEYGNEYGVDDIKDATKYERERYGKRDFKHGSPLHPGKGATIVKSEGLLDQLKQKFGKVTKNQSILSEDMIIDE
tara:strand:- start:21 stop:1160 length:1140 start_codon:yes stop_codon:yes gene_type:complete